MCQIANRDTGQSRRVANLLLAWHNAEENGGWDPTELWGVDTAVAEDMLTVLKLAKESRRYPGDLGFEPVGREFESLRARQITAFSSVNCR